MMIVKTLYTNIDRSQSPFKNSSRHPAFLILQSTSPLQGLGRLLPYTKLEEYGSTIQDASKAVEIDPKNSKGYYRRGAAYLAMLII
ncbi:hypothetical protein L1887_05513 [Cichorium endivia]|nr:hypothetical protein L1887_05513 [Cichorium endivia]